MFSFIVAYYPFFSFPFYFSVIFYFCKYVHTVLQKLQNQAIVRLIIIIVNMNSQKTDLVPVFFLNANTKRAHKTRKLCGLWEITMATKTLVLVSGGRCYILAL